MRKYWLLLLSLFMMNGAYSQTTNPLRDSLNLADKELIMRPDSIDLRLKKARWNVELGEWEYAKTEYDIVLQHQPDNLAALYFRAFVNMKLNRYGFARQDYMNVLRQVPNNFEAKLGLAILDDKDNKKTRAFDEINMLVEAFPDSAEAYAARAGMEKERQMDYLAVYDYSEAIVRDPANTDYILNRLDLLIKLGKREEARRDLELLVRLGIPRASLKEYLDKIKKN